MNDCGPECKPLVTLDEILQWDQLLKSTQVASLLPRTEFSVRGDKFCCHYDTCDKNSPWKSTEIITGLTPRTLVCHDMRGGYIEDRFVEGTSTDNAYRFFHWAGVDIFVYFSHNLLTIPPPGWISAGHINGVKVLGTFITEWNDGEATLKNIISDNETRNLCIEKMVDICEKFAFDGYLLNIENKMDEDLIPALKTFIKDLRMKLHEKLPNSELIWYDSITVDGSLKWQNELNRNNKPFFDVCDGILLNYPWREANLERSAAEAGGRVRDVFAGIDVFGRGSFGGGGFGSALAMAEARRHNLSSAIFAPGWTHEALGGVHFACTEYLFWANLQHYLYLRGPASLPLVTSFCQGFGRRGRARHGWQTRTTTLHWYNLASQRLQPTVSSCLDSRCLPNVEPCVCVAAAADQKAKVADESRGEAVSEPEPSPEAASTRVVSPAPECGSRNRGCVQHFEEDAFDGGGCLKISRRHREESQLSLHRVLLCDLISSTGAIQVIYATKRSPGDLSGDWSQNIPHLRLGFVVRATTSSEPRLVWVDDHPGSLVKRSASEKRWVPSSGSDSNETNDWRVWKHTLLLTDHIYEIIVGLPEECNSALFGWLEIREADDLGENID